MNHQFVIHVTIYLFDTSSIKFVDREKNFIFVFPQVPDVKIYLAVDGYFGFMIDTISTYFILYHSRNIPAKFGVMKSCHILLFSPLRECILDFRPTYKSKFCIRPKCVHSCSFGSVKLFISEKRIFIHFKQSIVAEAILDFRLDKKNPQTLIIHTLIKFNTTGLFLNNRDLRINQSNCIVGPSGYFKFRIQNHKFK